MKIKLKLRALTAYFSPNKVILADNEDLEIDILDKGQLSHRVVLLCNGKTYLADGKTVVIPRSELKAVNVLELSERDEADRVLRVVQAENLYVLPCGKDTSRLVAEREFYSKVLSELLREVFALKERTAAYEKRLAELENGKFTMLKFGGNTK